MKILGISGSPRKNGNCETLLKHIINKLNQKETVKTVKFSEKRITSCGTKCNYICLNPSRQGRSGKRSPCVLKDSDDVKIIYEEMIKSDVIITIVPNFGHSVPSVFHAFMERVEGMKYLLKLATENKKEIIVVLVSNEGSGRPLEDLESFFSGIWTQCEITPIIVSLRRVDPEQDQKPFKKLASSVFEKVQEIEKESK